MVPTLPWGGSAQLYTDLSSSVFSTQDALQHINGQREDNSGVFLSSDSGQRLKIPELKGGGRLGDNYGSFLQSSGRIHFPLSCNHLRSGKTGQLANSMGPPSSLQGFICLRQRTGLPRNPSTPPHCFQIFFLLKPNCSGMCLAQGILSLLPVSH